jgi:hypothetical protein
MTNRSNPEPDLESLDRNGSRCEAPGSSSSTEAATGRGIKVWTSASMTGLLHLREQLGGPATTAPHVVGDDRAGGVVQVDDMHVARGVRDTIPGPGQGVLDDLAGRCWDPALVLKRPGWRNHRQYSSAIASGPSAVSRQPGTTASSTARRA